MRTITIVGKGHWGKAPLTKNGTRALTTVVAALNQGSWAGDQSTAAAQGAGGSVAPSGGSDSNRGGGSRSNSS